MAAEKTVMTIYFVERNKFSSKRSAQKRPPELCVANLICEIIQMELNCEAIKCLLYTIIPSQHVMINGKAKGLIDVKCINVV